MTPSIERERFDHFFARAAATYYAAADPYRDFTTAPEISQIFGELLGAWARTVWTMLGEPPDIMLVEAGPGRGTLMADALRVWPAADVHFIETSGRLRAEQAARVPRATWHDRLDTLPDRPIILLANEFLDALPIRQFVCRPAGWHERHVENGAYVDLPTDFVLPADPPGTIREVNEAATAFIIALARRHAVALFIDYGPTPGGPTPGGPTPGGPTPGGPTPGGPTPGGPTPGASQGSSVQAIGNGHSVNPLATPGTADITAHVDFAALAMAAEAAGAAVQGPIKQNAFLTTLGLPQRHAALLHAAPHRAPELQAAAARLTAPEAMGSLFKVFAIRPPGVAPLPGFDA